MKSHKTILFYSDSCQTARVKCVINWNAILVVYYHRPISIWISTKSENPPIGLQFILNRWIVVSRNVHQMSKNGIFLPPLLSYLATINDWRSRRGNRRFIRDEKIRFSIARGVALWKANSSLYAHLWIISCPRLYGITNVAHKLMTDAIGFTSIILHMVE